MFRQIRPLIEIDVLGCSKSGEEGVVLAFPVGTARGEVALPLPSPSRLASMALSVFVGCTIELSSARLRVDFVT
jgi:hypothetical protein